MKVPAVKGTRDFYPPLMALRNYLVEKEVKELKGLDMGMKFFDFLLGQRSVRRHQIGLVLLGQQGARRPPNEE